MATARASAALRALPTEAKALIAKGLVGGSLEKLGKVRVFPKGIPYPDEWVISVLPSSGTNAKRIIEALVAGRTLARFEVFPYGIINPEIARIDIGIPARGMR
jgi:hypothetical protein